MNRMIMWVAIVTGLFAPFHGYNDTAAKPVLFPSPALALMSSNQPIVMALKDGDLYAIQTNDLSSRKLTEGGGLYTSNQWPYWFSPDHTKLLTIQKDTLVLVTKEGASALLANEVQNDPINTPWSVAWRFDSKGFVLWHVLAMRPQGVANPSASEILTYDLKTNKLAKLKTFNDQWVKVVLWDN